MNRRIIRKNRQIVMNDRNFNQNELHHFENLLISSISDSKAKYDKRFTFFSAATILGLIVGVLGFGSDSFATRLLNDIYEYFDSVEDYVVFYPYLILNTILLMTAAYNLKQKKKFVKIEGFKVPIKQELIFIKFIMEEYRLVVNRNLNDDELINEIEHGRNITYYEGRMEMFISRLFRKEYSRIDDRGLKRYLTKVILYRLLDEKYIRIKSDKGWFEITEEGKKIIRMRYKY